MRMYAYIAIHIYIYIYIGESDLSKMFTFMKMVITGVKNWFPDMIPVAFERKFDENFDGIPPGIYRPHILQIIQY